MREDAAYTERDENYIPWTMIEPLLRPGMTSRELVRAIFARLSLAGDGYRLHGAPGTGDLSTPEILRRGLWVVTNEQAAARRTRPVDPHEVLV